jgi:hypothetical protein
MNNIVSNIRTTAMLKSLELEIEIFVLEKWLPVA